MGFKSRNERYIFFYLFALKPLLDDGRLDTEDLRHGLFWLSWRQTTNLWGFELSSNVTSRVDQTAYALRHQRLTTELLQAEAEGRYVVNQQPSWITFAAFLRRNHPELAFVEWEPGWAEGLGLATDQAMAVFAEKYTGRISIL